MRLTLFLTSILLVACNSGNSTILRTKGTPLIPLSDVKTKLAFSCAYEKIPEPPVETDMLFQYARWLQKNNQLKQEKNIDVEIERLYRVAAEKNHYKANINLQNGAMRGQFKLTSEERLRFSQQLIDAHVATGYYMIAIYLQKGAAGLQPNEGMSLRYFRKAADEGSAYAQAYVAEKLVYCF